MTFFIFAYWSLALLTFFLPDWNTFSWWGWKGVITVIVFFTVRVIFVVFDDYSKFKKSKIYINGLNDFAFNVDEYKKFKAEHKEFRYEHKDLQYEDKKCAEEIVLHVGGRENIVQITHCNTRLKLVMKDNSKVDKKACENVEKVRGVFENNGQLQLIIGTGTVSRVYAGLLSITGLTEATKDDTKANS